MSFPISGLERIGFIFQTFNLLPVLSAEENVEYPLIAIQGTERNRASRPGLKIPCHRRLVQIQLASAEPAERWAAAASSHCAGAGDATQDCAG